MLPALEGGFAGFRFKTTKKFPIKKIKIKGEKKNEVLPKTKSLLITEKLRNLTKIITQTQ